MVEKSTQMGGVWGWRGVLGYISPSVYGSLMGETFSKAAPEGVGLLVATLGISEPNDETLEEALTHVDRAARQLADGGADFIHLGGPFGLILGIERIRELKKRLQDITKLPSGTMFTDLLDALKALSVKKVLHVSPGFRIGNYESRAKKLYEHNGFEMVNYKGLGIQLNVEARKLPMSLLYNAAKEAYLETPQADAIFISCGAWGGPAVVDCLEEDFGKPVLTVHSVFLWAGLKALRIRGPVMGYGRLFETL